MRNFYVCKQQYIAKLAEIAKQVGLAAWSKYQFSDVGVAGSISGHDNLQKPLGECAALARLYLIDGTKTSKSMYI